jgi:hypothetical protein
MNPRKDTLTYHSAYLAPCKTLASAQRRSPPYSVRIVRAAESGSLKMAASPLGSDSKAVLVRVGTNPSQKIVARKSVDAPVLLPDVDEYSQSPGTAQDYHQPLEVNALLRLDPALKEADASDHQARHITETELFRFMQTTNDILKQQNALLVALTERGTGIESSPKRPSVALRLLPDADVLNVPTLQTAPVVSATPSKGFESCTPVATHPVQQDLPDAAVGAMSLDTPQRKLFQSRGYSEANQSQFASPFDDAGFYSGSKHCGRRIDAIR